MYIGNTNCKPSLLLNNVCLEVVDEVNELGVVIDSRCTFHTHLRKNVVRASVRAKLIHKCFISHDVSTLIRAFKVYIRPILEYASTGDNRHNCAPTIRGGGLSSTVDKNILKPDQKQNMKAQRFLAMV